MYNVSNLFIKESDLPVENEFLLYTNYQGFTATSSKAAWEYTNFDTFINALATTGIKMYNSSDIIRAGLYEHAVYDNIIESLDDYTGFDFPVETLRCEISSDNRILTFYLESGNEFYFCNCNTNIDYIDLERTGSTNVAKYINHFTDIFHYGINIVGTDSKPAAMYYPCANFIKNIEYNPGSKNIPFVPVTVSRTIQYGTSRLSHINNDNGEDPGPPGISTTVDTITWYITHDVNTSVYINDNIRFRYIIPGCSPDRYTVIPKARHSFYSSSADVNVIKVFCSPESVENINKSNGITPELPGYIYLTEGSSSKLNDYIYKVNCSGATIDIPLANLCLIPHNKRLNAAGNRVLCSPGTYFYAYRVNYSNQLCSTRIHGGKFRKHSFILQHGFHLPICYYSAIVKALNASWVFQTCNNMYFLLIDKQKMKPLNVFNDNNVNNGLDSSTLTEQEKKNTGTNLQALLEDSTIQSKNNFFYYETFDYIDNPNDDTATTATNEQNFNRVSINKRGSLAYVGSEFRNSIYNF